MGSRRGVAVDSGTGPTAGERGPKRGSAPQFDDSSIAKMFLQELDIVTGIDMMVDHT